MDGAVPAGGQICRIEELGHPFFADKICKQYPLVLIKPEAGEIAESTYTHFELSVKVFRVTLLNHR
jgi:hypothetical protein